MKGKLFLVTRGIKLIILILIAQSLKAQTIENIAHRGGAGLLPENSIPAFLNALDSSATVLEMDVVISKDQQVVVSHDLYISSDFCLREDGTEIKKSDERNLLIYKMTYDEIKTFDCGTKGRKDLPDQERVPVSKPLLVDVIKETERYIKSYTQYEVNYLIEIKSTQKGEGTENPSPEEFSDLVYDVIDAYLPWDRVIIQSFDFRVLRYWHERYPDVKLSALVATIKSDKAILNSLGFTPTIYSPFYKLIRKRTINDLHSKGIKVYPWTVNDEKDMEKMLKWGVNGVITDYPNILSRVIQKSISN